MEVILRDHVDNLGKRGEIVKVADGYARNFLLPRKLALPATDANKKWVERERKISEVRDSGRARRRPKRSPRGSRRSTSSSPAGSVRTISCTDRSPTPTSPMLLAKKGFELDRRKILLPDPIKALGESTVPVKLHRDVTAQSRSRWRKRRRQVGQVGQVGQVRR